MDRLLLDDELSLESEFDGEISIKLVQLSNVSDELTFFLAYCRFVNLLKTKAWLPKRLRFVLKLILV